ncbi:MAG: lysophospholipid acyltransferase family protein [Pseudomonadota bacterium]
MRRPPRWREQLEYGAVAAFWWAMRPFRPESRWAFAGACGRRLGPRLWFSERAETALRAFMPEMSPEQRRAVIARMTENFSRLLIEYESLPALYAHAPRWRVSGLEHLEAARAAGGGRLVVASAHYGNWEAVRAVCQLHGAPLGLIYRAFNNKPIDDWFFQLIASVGQPVFHKGNAGARGLFRHIASGKGAMILVDQRQGGGPILDFLGQPAETSLAAAQLALRTRSPLITARARRVSDGFEAAFEPAVPADDPAAMMQVVNDRIAAWVREDPAQWFWLHRRWKIRRQTKVRKGSGKRVEAASAAAE